jgi:hypothetical protein
MAGPAAVPLVNEMPVYTANIYIGSWADPSLRRDVEVIRKTQPIPVIEHQPYTSMTEL